MAASEASSSGGGSSTRPSTGRVRITVATILTGSGTKRPPKAGEAMRKAPIRRLATKAPVRERQEAGQLQRGQGGGALHQRIVAIVSKTKAK